MQIYLHVGYPKNASTTLQMDVFPNLPKIQYCGRVYGTNCSFVSQRLADAIHSISFEDSLQFDAIRVGAQIQGELEKITDDPDGNILISWEAFSHNVADRGVIAARLKHLFPTAKVLFVIRNQVDSIESMYHFLVAQGGGNINPSYGRPSVRSLRAWVSDQNAFIYRSYLETLNYFDIYAQYAELFGSENVKVLLFEDLRDSPSFFFAELSAFFSVENIPIPLHKRNVRAATPLGQAAKFSNFLRRNGYRFYLPRFVSSPIKKVINSIRLKRFEDKLTTSEWDALSDKYRQNNLKLQNVLGIDLSAKGYPI